MLEYISFTRNVEINSPVAFKIYVPRRCSFVKYISNLLIETISIFEISMLTSLHTHSILK